jgi:hypothetical protein
MQGSEKSSQNPYKTGVLISNFVEDKFGQDLAQTKVSYKPQHKPLTLETFSIIQIPNSLV